MLHASQPDQVRPVPKPDTSVAERIAAIMFDLNAEEGCATRERILDRMDLDGLTSLDLDLYGVEARQIANKSMVRREDRPAARRAARIKLGANYLGHIMPSVQEICAALQLRSFTKTELDDILPEIIAQAADDFAHKAGAQ